MVLCDASLDVAFVVDLSSRDQQEFKSIKTVAKKIVGGFSFNKTGPRAALVSFSDQAVMQMPFELYENPTNFKNAIDLLAMEKGERKLSTALEVTFKDLFSGNIDGRTKNPKMVFLITTGQQRNDSGLIPPSFVAEQFHEVGIKIFALGVGKDVNKDELVKITKDKELVRVIKNPEDLKKEDVWKNLTMNICFGSG